MSRRKNKKHHPYTGMATRQQMQAKQQERELREAQQGFIEESEEEIAKEVARDFPEEKMSEGTKAETEDSVPVTMPEKEKPRRQFVLDTNLLISCPDIIYDKDDKDWRKPKKFRPKLDNADIIIPYVVFEELNHIKSEISYRGMVARKILRRLSKILPNSGRDLDSIMNLRKLVPTGWKTQTITILPLHRNFYKILPWIPDRDDNDGWIAVTALAATMIQEGLPVDGTKSDSFNIMKRDNTKESVTLLTNDRALLSAADDFAVHSERYSFEKPQLFTGCRELTVPAEMFKKFYNEEGLSREDFEDFMPDEPALVANEYIIMNLEDESDYPRGYFVDNFGNNADFKNIARYNKKNEMLYPLRFIKHEGKVPANAGIATYYDAMNDDKIKVVNVTGLAGTGKTYQAIVHAVKEVKAGRFVQVVLIPSKSAKNPLGALPGGKEQKVEPLVAMAKSAIRSYLASTPEFRRKRELLLKHGDVNDDDLEETNEKEKDKKSHNDRSNRDSRRTTGRFNGSFEDYDSRYDDISPEDFGDNGHSKKKKNKAFYPGKSEKGKNGGEGKVTYREALEKETNYIYSRYFVCIPYEEAQGDSFEDSIIIVDEAQRLQVDDADTVLSRPAKNSKLFVMGDVSQIHDSSPEKMMNNALCYSRMLFGDWEGCANIYLVDNMRSDIAEIMTRNRDKVRRMMGLV